MRPNYHRRYTPWLVALLAMFVFRVVAQGLQFLHPVAFLPPFAAWDSGTLPYGWLVVAQGIIIAGCGIVVTGFFRQTTRPNRRLGKWFLAIGAIYLFGMLARLVAGFTIAAGNKWLDAPLPAFFHLVLASFLLIVGHFHFRWGDE